MGAVTSVNDATPLPNWPSLLRPQQADRAGVVVARAQGLNRAQSLDVDRQLGIGLVAGAQLAISVVAPALDAAAGQERANVPVARRQLNHVGQPLDLHGGLGVGGGTDTDLALVVATPADHLLVVGDGAGEVAIGVDRQGLRPALGDRLAGSRTAGGTDSADRSLGGRAVLAGAGFACVLRADAAVITVGGFGALLGAAADGGMAAGAGLGVAGILGARVTIVAIDLVSLRTLASVADRVDRAGVIVGAILRLGGADATAGTLVFDRAQVTVITGLARSGVGDLAGARVALGHQALVAVGAVGVGLATAAVHLHQGGLIQRAAVAQSVVDRIARAPDAAVLAQHAGAVA